MDSKNSWLMDATGDVVIGKGITLADYDKTIAQRIQNKIALQYGEWFLHNQEGVRWFSVNDLPGVFGREVTEINLDTQIKEYIENYIHKRSTGSATSSNLDEIRTLKELLDIGAITDEEFEAKKAQLLNL